MQRFRPSGLLAAFGVVKEFVCVNFFNLETLIFSGVTGSPPHVDQGSGYRRTRQQIAQVFDALRCYGRKGAWWQGMLDVKVGVGGNRVTHLNLVFHLGCW
jgi:hypothetical protein